MAEDCGPCTQLVVTMAEREGVSPHTLRAILAGDRAALPPDTLGFRFARAVLERDVAEADRLRSEVVSRWGRKALVTLALTIAASRVSLGEVRARTRTRLRPGTRCGGRYPSLKAGKRGVGKQPERP
jgi:hypothetical protein